MEFCLWNAEDDQTNYQRNLSLGEVEIEDGAIYHTTEYRERRDHYAVYGVNAPVAGFDTDRDAFLGPQNGFAEAAVPHAGVSTDSVASGWYPIGSHRLDVTLAPGESTSFTFTLGYLENPRDDKWERPGVIRKDGARSLLRTFATREATDAAFARLQAYWDDLLGSYTVESGDERLDRMVNIWNQYQCMVTYNMSRSASYFETGIGRGMGFRDSNQDLLGFVHLVPDRARERIIDIASTQFQDGSAYHQYQPLTKRGNNAVGSGFNDDPLWLIAGVAAYIKETGDFGILDERVPFDNDESTATSLMEHLKRSFDHVIDNRGPHGLPLIGRADWNDCLNLNCFSETPGESFQTTQNRTGNTAESVFIAGMFVAIGADYATLARRRGDGPEADRAEDAIRAMRAAVLEHGWDGDWFLRAYDFFGTRVGSRENTHGQIWIEPQGFCVMAGIGLDDGKAIRALDATRARLNTPHGIVLLNPAYTGLPPGAGRGDLIPAGLQGERRDLLPQQPLDHHRGDHGGSRRAGVGVLHADRAGVPRADLGGASPGALCVRPDDRGQGRGAAWRGQELVADGNGILELRGRVPVPAGRTPRLRRPGRRPMHQRGDRRVHRPSTCARGGLRHHGTQLGRQGRQAGGGRGAHRWQPRALRGARAHGAGVRHRLTGAGDTPQRSPDRATADRTRTRNDRPLAGSVVDVT